MNMRYAKIEAQIKYRSIVNSERYIPMLGQLFLARANFAHKHYLLYNKHVAISGYIFVFLQLGEGTTAYRG